MLICPNLLQKKKLLGLDFEEQNLHYLEQQRSVPKTNYFAKLATLSMRCSRVFEGIQNISSFIIQNNVGIFQLESTHNSEQSCNSFSPRASPTRIWLVQAFKRHTWKTGEELNISQGKKQVCVCVCKANFDWATRSITSWLRKVASVVCFMENTFFYSYLVLDAMLSWLQSFSACWTNCSIVFQIKGTRNMSPLRDLSWI